MAVAHPTSCACETCGARASLLDRAYQAPDCVWAQPVDERSSRNNVDFAELGERRFVRGLLPVPLANGEEFRFGVWLEVDEQTFDEVVASWNDEARYPDLRFTATVANAVVPWQDRILGAHVDVGVRDPNARPFVSAARAPWLQAVVERGWTMAEYEATVASFV